MLLAYEKRTAGVRSCGAGTAVFLADGGEPSRHIQLSASHMNVRHFVSLAVAAALMTTAGCASTVPFSRAPASVAPVRRWHPSRSHVPGSFVQTGVASYYAREFHRRRTASGERYDMHAMTAAHCSLPFNTRVRVVNLDNGRSTVVRINDRGPFKKRRIIDVSLAAAQKLGMTGPGTARVRIEVVP